MRWPGSGRPAQRRYPGNELALELIVKYQQNPLCAARALAHMHVAANDAIVELAATSSGEAAQAVAAQTVAVHVASAALLAHFYPRESPGRIEALGIGAMLAVAAKSGISPEALAAPRQEGPTAPPPRPSGARLTMAAMRPGTRRIVRRPLRRSGARHRRSIYTSRPNRRPGGGGPGL